MKKQTDRIPQGVRFDVFRRDGFTCRYCGRSSPDVVLHCDHVKPRSKGGEDAMTNFVTACTDCNYGKRAKEGVEAPASSNGNGLIGLYGYTYKRGYIEWQFKIVGMYETRCLVQLFSWMGGETIEVKPLEAEYVLGRNCKLFADKEAWLDENKKNDYKIDRRERSREIKLLDAKQLPKDDSNYFESVN